MGRFLAWRLAATLVTIVVSLSAVFFGMLFVPGDSAQAGLGESTLTPDQMTARRADFGLDLPPGEQYLRYMGRLVEGNLGISWMSGQQVGVMIGQQMGASLELTLAALVIAVLIGFPLGIALAYSSNPGLLVLLQGVTAFALSTPSMISGTVLVLIFALTLHWLPATGQSTPAHLLLPAGAIGISVGASLAKAVEAGLTDVRSQPFVEFARAKGLSGWQTLWRHALPVSLLPVLEMLSLQVGYLFSGAVITENLFARQGLGRLLVTGILNKDIPVVLGVAFASILLYAVLHLITEIAYAWLDPRIRTTS